MSEVEKRPATELEFAAKRVNDLLARTLPHRELGFMTFVFDVGDGGYLGYVASPRRVDAFRMITEWLERSVNGFSRADIVEVLKEYEKELSSCPSK